MKFKPWSGASEFVETLPFNLLGHLQDVFFRSQRVQGELDSAPFLSYTSNDQATNLRYINAKLPEKVTPRN